MNFKDLYFEFNEKHGNGSKISGELTIINSEIDKLIAAYVSDREQKFNLDINIGRLCVASEYKGFLLGLVAASHMRDNDLPPGTLSELLS